MRQMSEPVAKKATSVVVEARTLDEVESVIAKYSPWETRLGRLGFMDARAGGRQSSWRRVPMSAMFGARSDKGRLTA